MLYDMQSEILKTCTNDSNPKPPIYNNITFYIGELYILGFRQSSDTADLYQAGRLRLEDHDMLKEGGKRSPTDIYMLK